MDFPPHIHKGENGQIKSKNLIMNSSKTIQTAIKGSANQQ